MFPLRIRLGLTAAGMAVLLGGCAQIHPLPTVSNDGGWCREIGDGGVLRGASADPRIAWGETTVGTRNIVLRQDLVWPSGYTARFAPQLEILDASRRVRYVAGDIIDGGCTTGPDAQGPMYVIEE